MTAACVTGTLGHATLRGAGAIEICIKTKSHDIHSRRQAEIQANSYVLFSFCSLFTLGHFEFRW